MKQELPKPRAPVTMIRNRFKAPRLTHKSVTALRKSHRTRTPSTAGIHVRPVLGDGFDSSELHIDRRLHKRKQRKTRKPLLLGFSALDIGKGPLPDVKFESASSQLGMGRSDSNDDVVGLFHHGNSAEVLNQSEINSTRKVARRVSFSDRIREDKVMAELSSISAPIRTYSVSSGEDEDSDEALDDDESVEHEHERRSSEPVVEADEEDFVEIDEQDEHSSPTPTPSRNQMTMRRSSYRSNNNNTTAPESTNTGVTLSFRNRKPPGIAPQIRFGKRRLIEVSERIIDNPTTEQHHLYRPITITSTLPHDDEDDYMLDSEPPINPKPHGRPRSILRNHTPNFQESDTRPSATAANTRRNSEINLEESRYFTTASSSLHSHQPKPLNDPRIIKSRTPDRRKRYRYNEIQVPDSESIVPETSRDCTSATHPNVLKRNSETYWTSSESLPGAPPMRDLRTLTRSVSREAGTLSQAVHRTRPSLPFQSPTKI